MRNTIIALLISVSALAQVRPYDALKPQFSHQYFYWNQIGYHFIDTNLQDLSWYHQLNTAEQDDFGSLNLMNMGGPRNQLLVPQLNPLLDYYSFGPYQDYFTSPTTVRYYQTRSPLTAARYINGYDRGQLFRIYHTQNINKDWNFALAYRRLNSLSFYINDQNKQSSFTLNTNYKSKNGAYKAMAYFASEKMELQENGGILFDSIFTQNLETTRTLYLTNLDRDERAIYNRDLFLDQQIDFYKLFRRKAKSKLDTLDTLSVLEEVKEEKNRNFLLGHQFRYQRKASAYYGRTNSFYQNYFFDTDANYTDSIRFSSLYNEAYIQTILGDSSRFDFKAGAFHQYFEYGNQYFFSNAQQVGLRSKLQGNYLQYFDLQAEGSYVISGPFANDFDIKVSANGRFYKSIGAFASYQIQNKHPDLFLQSYISNNYIWNANLRPILSNDLQFGIQWGENNFLRFRTFSATNWVYLNQDLNPQVASSLIGYQAIDLQQNFKFWNFLHQDNRLSYQIPLDGEQFLPLPELVNRHSLYFQFSIFKRAAQVLLGAEVQYFSSFNSPSYSAATGQMFLANEYPIGNYYMIDAFAQFKVAKAIIFLKMQNLGQDILPYNYWAAPHFPLNDRVFRVGVNWRFFN